MLRLQQLTSSVDSAAATSCPSNLVFMADVNRLASDTTYSNPIPKIVHQTSKSRCVTQKVAQAAKQWRFDGDWSYFFHDDEALMRLLVEEHPEFPHLELIARNCLVHGTLRADLWRYLVLWVYGGVYADVDAVPRKFTAETLGAADQAFFVVEQYHLLSQWFMAVSPKHPIMYYAIQQSLSNLLQAPDTGRIAAPLYTGPHALHAAYIQFRHDAVAVVESAIPGHKPVGAGHFGGTRNRTVTVVGVAARQNEYVNRDVLGKSKLREYAQMNMRHFQDDKSHASGLSCLSSMFTAYYEKQQIHLRVGE